MLWWNSSEPEISVQRGVHLDQVCIKCTSEWKFLGYTSPSIKWLMLNFNRPHVIKLKRLFLFFLRGGGVLYSVLVDTILLK